MTRHGMDSDANLLQRRWLLHMQGYARALGRVPVLWQEAFAGTGWALDPTAIVHVWKWWKDGADELARPSARKLLAPGSTRQSVLSAAKFGAGPGPVDPDAWQAELARVTARVRGRRGPRGGRGCAGELGVRRRAGHEPACTVLQAACTALQAACTATRPSPPTDRPSACEPVLQGFKAVLSAPWYLNLGTYADEDWKAYYRADPRDFQPANVTQVGCGGGCDERGGKEGCAL